MAEQFTFPTLDEWGTPTVKLPNCPRCDEDELGVINEVRVMCYACNWEAWRDPGKQGWRPVHAH